MKNMQPKADGALHKKGSVIASVLALMFAAGFLLVLSGCQNPLAQRDAQRATGALSLTIGTPPTAVRTIHPDTPTNVAFDHWILDFVSLDGGQDVPGYEWDGESDIELEVGLWRLTARAFDGDDDDPVAIGFIENIDIGPGRVNRYLDIAPYPGGYGTFQMAIPAVSANVAGITARIYALDEAGIAAADHFDYVALAIGTDRAATGNIADIPSGRYLVLFTLASNVGDEADIILDGGILRVYRNLTSIFSDPADLFANVLFRGDLLAAMAEAWNGTAFYGMTITAQHFTILEITGVGANLPGVLSRFAAHHPRVADAVTPAFPTAHGAFRDLVDAALVYLSTRANIATGGANTGERADALAWALSFALNRAGAGAVSHTWATPAADWLEIGDQLSITIGAYTVPSISFIGTEVEFVEISVTAPGVADLPSMGITFPQATRLAPPPDAITVTVTNVGNLPTGALTVSVNQPGLFVLTGTNIGSLAVGGEPATFTVQPASGLTATTHNAIVTVSGDDLDESTTFPVSVTVVYALVDEVSITIDGDDEDLVIIEVDDEVTLAVTIGPAGANQSVTWSIYSGDEYVELVGDVTAATIVARGIAAGGSAVIRAQATGMAAQVTVVVEAADVELPLTQFMLVSGIFPRLPAWNANVMTGTPLPGHQGLGVFHHGTWGGTASATWVEHNGSLSLRVASVVDEDNPTVPGSFGIQVRDVLQVGDILTVTGRVFADVAAANRAMVIVGAGGWGVHSNQVHFGDPTAAAGQAFTLTLPIDATHVDMFPTGGPEIRVHNNAGTVEAFYIDTITFNRPERAPIQAELGDFFELDGLTAAWQDNVIVEGGNAGAPFHFGTWNHVTSATWVANQALDGLYLRVDGVSGSAFGLQLRADLIAAGDTLNVTGRAFGGAAPSSTNRAMVIVKAGDFDPASNQVGFDHDPGANGIPFDLTVGITDAHFEVHHGQTGAEIRIHNNAVTDPAAHFIIESITLTRATDIPVSAINIAGAAQWAFTTTGTATRVVNYAIVPADATNQALQWVSSIPAVATVAEAGAGQITITRGSQAGTTRITATSVGNNAITAFVDVLVYDPADYTFHWTAVDHVGTQSFTAQGTNHAINGINWTRNNGSNQPVSNDGLSIGNLLLVLGLESPGPANVDNTTTATANPSGVFNFTRASTLFIDYHRVTGTGGAFQVQINNTTTSEASSVHGPASRVRTGALTDAGGRGTLELELPRTFANNAGYLANATLTLRGDGALAGVMITGIRLWQEPETEGAGITISFPDLTNQAPDASVINDGDPIIVYLSSEIGATVTVANPQGQIRWFLGGTEIIGQATGTYNAELVLTGAILGPQLGTRFLTVAVEIDGRLYGTRVAITVRL